MNDIIAIVVVNYNGYNTLGNLFLRCLDSIVEATLNCPYAKFKLFFVDNGSTDKSASIAKQKKFIVIQLKTNLGYAGATYIATKYIVKKFGVPKFLICLNNDIIIEKDAFFKIIKTIFKLKEQFKSFLASPLLINGYTNRLDHGGHFVDPSGTAWSLSLVLNFNLLSQLNKPIFLSYCDGAFWIMDNVALAKVGVFDHRFFMYYEDVEVSLRAWSKGIPSILLPIIAGTHYRSATSSFHPEVLYYILRNKIITLKNYFGIKGILMALLYYGFYVFRLLDANILQNYSYFTKQIFRNNIKDLYKNSRFIIRALIDGFTLRKSINLSLTSSYSFPYLQISPKDFCSTKRLIGRIINELKKAIFKSLYYNKLYESNFHKCKYE
jgi:GT2 family glycosyltransferase